MKAYKTLTDVSDWSDGVVGILRESADDRRRVAIAMAYRAILEHPAANCGMPTCPDALQSAPAGPCPED